MTRRFRLQRDVDASGVSGTGVVAVGVVFPSGTVVLEWVTRVTSHGFYASVTDMETVHGHGGQTRVVWEDP